MKKRILAALLAVAMLACSLAACSTRSTVSLEKETLYFRFSTIDTVAWETPARAATSDEVAFFFATGSPPLLSGKIFHLIRLKFYPSLQGA